MKRSIWWPLMAGLFFSMSGCDNAVDCSEPKNRGSEACPFRVVRVTPDRAGLDSQVPVVIHGQNFATGMIVTFNGAFLTDLRVESATRITGTIPTFSETGAVDVVLRRGNVEVDRLEGGFTYLENLRVNEVFPESLPEGEGGTLTVLGEGFDADVKVDLDGTALTFALLSPEQVSVQIPASLEVGYHDLKLTRRVEAHTLEDAFAIGGWAADRSRLGIFRELVRVDAQTLLAVGGSRRLFRSTNGGATWSELRPVSGACDIEAIRRFDWAVFLATSCGLLVDEGGAALWRRLTRNPVTDVESPREGEIYVLESWKVLRSLDAGDTWVEVAKLDQLQSALMVVPHADGDRIITADQTELHAWTEHGSIPLAPAGNGLRAARRPTRDGLLVAFLQNRLMRSGDGGETWQEFTGPPMELDHPRWVRFDRAGCLWISTLRSEVPARTCDPDAVAPRWDIVALPAVGVIALDAGGPVLSSDGSVLYEGQGGAARIIGMGLPYVPASGMRVEPQAPGRIAIRSGNGVAVSSDSGETWHVPTGCLGTRLLRFEADNGLWAPRLFDAQAGVIYLSDAEGEECVERRPPGDPVELSPSRLVEGRFVMRGMGGTLLTTENEGVTTTRVSFEGPSASGFQAVALQGEDWICLSQSGDGAPVCMRWDGSDRRSLNGVPVAVQRKDEQSDRLWLRTDQPWQIGFTDDLSTVHTLSAPAPVHSFRVEGETLVATMGEHPRLRAYVSHDLGESWEDWGPVPRFGGNLRRTATGTLLWAGDQGLFRAGPANRPQ